MKINTILVGDARERLRELPAGSVQCVVTSPPYWGLRDYQTEPLVWGGKTGCRHWWEVLSRRLNNRHALAMAEGIEGKDGVFGLGKQRSDGGNPSDWNVRSQSCIRCAAWRGHLGLEPTSDLYVQHLVEIFREIRRVLRPDGTVWMVIADSYSGGNVGYPPMVGEEISLSGKRPINKTIPEGNQRNTTKASGLPALNLIGVPWRVAFALQADGWYLRSDTIWSKPNPMPESVDGWAWVRCRVKVGDRGCGRERQRVGSNPNRLNQDHDGDGFLASGVFADCLGCKKCLPNDGLVLQRDSWRPTKAHEYVFMLVKSERYYGDAEEVRLPVSLNWEIGKGPPVPEHGSHVLSSGHRGYQVKCVYEEAKGANLRSVWTILIQPYAAAHSATFPEALVERCIKASTSEKGCCQTCGVPWARVVCCVDSADKGPLKGPKHGVGAASPGPIGGGKLHSTLGGEQDRIVSVGWRPSCSCPIGDPTPCVVLDPFMGSGTVAVVAERLGRSWVGVDLSEAYVKQAWTRIKLARRGKRVSKDERHDQQYLKQSLLVEV